MGDTWSFDIRRRVGSVSEGNWFGRRRSDELRIEKSRPAISNCSERSAASGDIFIYVSTGLVLVTLVHYRLVMIIHQKTEQQHSLRYCMPLLMSLMFRSVCLISHAFKYTPFPEPTITFLSPTCEDH